MPSQKQILANQRNAQYSTGPKTEEGRATSSRNSLRHGLTAKEIVLADEKPEEFEAFRSALREDYAPVGAIEFVLVERIVEYHWRLRRAPRYEQSLFEGNQIGDAFIVNPSSIAGSNRHEAHLARLYERTVSALEQRQALRRAEAIQPSRSVPVESAKDYRTAPLELSLPEYPRGSSS